MQVPFFWITVFVNILQLSFSIYIFPNLNMVIRSSNSCFSLFIYRGTPPCDHLVYTTTSCLSSPLIVFPPGHENLRVIIYFEDLFNATTSVSRPGFYRINGVPLYFLILVFHIVEQRKMCASWTMEINVKN